MDPDSVGTEIELEDAQEQLAHENETMEKWTCVNGQLEQAMYRDNLTGDVLPMKLVEAARKEELEFMDDWHVWDVVPTALCWQKTNKGPLGGRWVDTNKGDTKKPNIRCRYVAKDIAYQKDDSYFAAMPPLEVLRMLLSWAATGRKCGRGGKKIMVIDARKAHLHATPDREIFVELPPEVRKPGSCARLR